MEGKFITEKQVADLIGKSFSNLEIIIPDQAPKRVYTSGILSIKPGENTGLVLNKIDSTEVIL